MPLLSNCDDSTSRIRTLTTYGCQVEVQDDVPPRRYFRSGLEMLRMANIYTDEGNYENAFILYSKFITLFVEKLPRHPEYKASPAADRQRNKKKLTTVFGIAEEIKKKLVKQYDAEYQVYLEEEKRLAEERAREQARREEEADRQRIAAEAAAASMTEQQRLAEEQNRLDQFANLQELERRKLAEQERARSELSNLAIAGSLPAVPGYDPGELPPAYDLGQAPGYVPAGLPSNSVQVLPSMPEVPSRGLKPATAPPAPADNYSVPAVDRTLKPSSSLVDHFTSTGGVTDNMYGLRTMLIPGEVALKFMNIALQNTLKSVETLALLCGTMSHDSFRITHLVVPKQTGTADSCDMMGEEDVFDVQDKYNLLTLGWIHTHPTQTAFLSSVDMHQHCSYQRLLPEAVAIVCSPKFKETGYFFLTPHHGLDIIGNCPERGFHPHQKEPPLFEDCPHVKVDNSLTVTILDLRNR